MLWSVVTIDNCCEVLWQLKVLLSGPHALHYLSYAKSVDTADDTMHHATYDILLCFK